MAEFKKASDDFQDSVKAEMREVEKQADLEEIKKLGRSTCPLIRVPGAGKTGRRSADQRQQKPSQEQTGPEQRTGRQRMADEELRMPFWSHLEELRKRIVVCPYLGRRRVRRLFQLFRGSAGLLLCPMNMKIGLQAAFPYFTFTPNTEVQQLHFTTLTEPFMAHLKIAFVAGFMLVVPVILYQVWKFIAPGLLPRERRYAGYFVLFSTLFFVIGRPVLLLPAAALCRAFSDRATRQST